MKIRLSDLKCSSLHRQHQMIGRRFASAHLSWQTKHPKPAITCFFSFVGYTKAGGRGLFFHKTFFTIVKRILGLNKCFDKTKLVTPRWAVENNFNRIALKEENRRAISSTVTNRSNSPFDLLW